jgi:hypothetical protein
MDFLTRSGAVCDWGKGELRFGGGDTVFAQNAVTVGDALPVRTSKVKVLLWNYLHYGITIGGKWKALCM